MMLINNKSIFKHTFKRVRNATRCCTTVALASATISSCSL